MLIVVCALPLLGISCGLPEVINGTILAPSVLYGDVATYTCTEGYRTYDNLTTENITCQTDKSWSKDPKCACKKYLNVFNTSINL